MRAAIYVRVSNRYQHPENQLPTLRDWAARKGWTVAREYNDKERGANPARPAFQRMLRDARQHRFDVLLFWSLDRLTREGIWQTLEYLRRLSELGIAWHSFQEPYIDTTGPWGDLLVAFLAKIAALERQRMSERIRAGLARARREGRSIGRPRVVIDVVRAREMLDAGMSKAAVARKLQVSRSALTARLKESH